MNRITITIIATIALILLATIVVISLARGYQIDFTKKEFSSTGILVATSDPDGAEVLINGKLKTATNNTINLPPGIYKVKIVKDGFTPWEKEITIKKEEVFKTNAFLFPSVPDLRPMTLTGAINPASSPDNFRIAFGVASASAEKNGIWIVDTGRIISGGSIFSGADFRQIYQDTAGLSLSQSKLIWSPDSREIIASVGANLTVLLQTDRNNDQPIFVTNNIKTIFSEWNEQTIVKNKAQTNKLQPGLQALLATTSANVRFSPDETKILYQATTSAYLPTYLNTYLPGSNPTLQTRQLVSGKNYVYDIKEDRNYLINDSVVWFPSSRHLLSSSNSQISIMEYDGTNKALIYAGPFKSGFVLSWPNWSKIVILTSLNNLPGAQENLYTVNLR